ncbi:DUF4395 domain-containing protein [Demequina oxidasica]|uniref:DUF4395 domain-containing protein n=1 Tax=Demequina oxidasica TaxID=676199 RepID=UPI000A073CAD|nr:DUF4395 domain-containing protein [Demequina oxidasica]
MTSDTPTTKPAPASGDLQIDPRGPRFGAAITLVLAIAALVVGANVVGVVIMAVLALMFVPGAVVGPQATLQAALFKRFVRPKLAPPSETESFRAPRFAQQVGLAFSILAVVFGALGSGVGFFIFAGFVAVASFLNAVFNFCLGCEIYLLTKRLSSRNA